MNPSCRTKAAFIQSSIIKRTLVLIFLTQTIRLKILTSNFDVKTLPNAKTNLKIQAGQENLPQSTNLNISNEYAY